MNRSLPILILIPGGGGCLIDIPSPVQPDAAVLDQCSPRAPDAGTGCAVKTDGYNCGACGRACDPTQHCDDGLCTPLILTRVGYAPRVGAGLEDGTWVWTVVGGGPPNPTQIRRYRIGVDAEPSTITTIDELYGMAIDAQNVVFEGAARGVFRVDLQATDATPEQLMTAGDMGVSGLHLHQGFVYVGSGNAGITRVDLRSHDTLAFAGTEQIGVVRGDSTHLYWLAFANGSYRVRRLAYDAPGQVPETVGSTLADAWDLTVGPSSLLVSAPGEQRIYRLPKPGVSCQPQAYHLDAAPRFGVEDGAYLYVDAFTGGSAEYPLEGSVWRIPIAGGPPLLMLPKLSNDYPAILVRPEALYAMDNDFYRLLKVPK